MNGRNETSELFDLERLGEETFVEDIVFRREVASTNTLALEMASRDKRATPLLILTDRQTGGRGRGANKWWSSHGALTFSLVLDAEKWDLPVERWSQVSLTVGLAVCGALQALLPEADVGLKWPNDVYLESRKVCGILVEVPHDCPRRVIVGIGLNVNNEFVSAPAELQMSATSMWEVTRTEYELTEILVKLLQSLADELEQWSAGESRLSERWKSRCLLTDRTVHLKVGEQRMMGVCGGIDDDGALIVHTPNGVKHVPAGVVEKFQ